MRSLSRHIPKVIFVSFLLALTVTGCAQWRGAQFDKYQQILSDPSLTKAEKAKQIDALNKPSSPYDPVSQFMFVSGAALIVGSLIYRRRQVRSRTRSGPALAVENLLLPEHPTVPEPPASVSPQPVRQRRRRAQTTATLRPKASKSAPTVKTPRGSAISLKLVSRRAKKKAPPSTSAETAAESPATPPVRRKRLVELVDTLPDNQEQVDAIPVEQRGVSFFSSRPAALDDLTEVTVVIGDRERLVLATPQEAADISAGDEPHIRAFTIDGHTLPWYAWENYDPYRDYWVAARQEWRGFVDGVVACWITSEDCPAEIGGYYASDDELEVVE